MITATAIHIDTVQLSHAYRRADLPSSDELLKRDFSISFKERAPSGVICNASFRPFGKKAREPRLNVTISDGGYCGITAELSIAKLLDGNGLGNQTAEDIECALDAVQDFIRQRVGVEFEAATAKVKRLDANADFPVGENRIHSFVRSIKCPSSRMTQGTLGRTTVNFFNRSRTLIVYGKRAEVEAQFKRNAATAANVEAATGLLRVESRLRGPQIQRLAKKLGVPAVAGDLLTLPAAERIVCAALNELGLDTPKTTAQTRDGKLVEVFGGDAPAMLGILEWKARYGEEALRKIWSRSKFYRLRGQLIETDFWLATAGEELPALSVSGVSNNNPSYSNLGIGADDLPDHLPTIS